MLGNQLYQWRTGQRYIGDAQEIADHIARLAELKGGGLTTDELVADALDERSPLHPNIEKDEQVAAHNWRKHQVRNLIGALVRVTVKEEPQGEREVTIRAFPHVEGLYRPAEVVITETQLNDAYQKILYHDLLQTRQRIANFAAFSGVVKAIDNLPEIQIGDKHERSARTISADQQAED